MFNVGIEASFASIDANVMISADAETDIEGSLIHYGALLLDHFID